MFIFLRDDDEDLNQTRRKRYEIRNGFYVDEYKNLPQNVSFYVENNCYLEPCNKYLY